MSLDALAGGLLAALAVVLLVAIRGNVGKVRIEEARALVADGAVLLDVRSTAEFASGHLPNAVNIPVQELGRRLGELDPATPVVVYCASGIRSASAASRLKWAGLAAHDLGAMSRW